jgi:electron transfer flavoprotein beta subunit
MIVVCMKWVALRPEVDSLTGETATDARWSGASLADQAALELALQIAEQRNLTVTVLTVGTADAEPILREALSCGATDAVQIDAATNTSSHSVAANIASWMNTVGTQNIELVLCGDWSADRGSGSVPVFLAEALGLDDACGLVTIDVAGEVIHAERRLDGGRRERLKIELPAVLSVEGVAARLRRAPLSGLLRAKSEPITIVPATHTTHVSESVRSAPYRPRTRVLDGPSTSLSPLRRVEILTGALNERTPPRKLTLDPEDAADAILEQLATWGYELPEGSTDDLIRATDGGARLQEHVEQ